MTIKNLYKALTVVLAGAVASSSLAAEGKTQHVKPADRPRITIVTYPDGHVSPYFYDKSGKVIPLVVSVTDPKGHVTRFNYDASGNFVSSRSNGSPGASGKPLTVGLGSK